MLLAVGWTELVRGITDALNMSPHHLFIGARERRIEHRARITDRLKTMRYHVFKRTRSPGP